MKPTATTPPPAAQAAALAAAAVMVASISLTLLNFFGGTPLRRLGRPHVWRLRDALAALSQAKGDPTGRVMAMPTTVRRNAISQIPGYAATGALKRGPDEGSSPSDQKTPLPHPLRDSDHRTLQLAQMFAGQDKLLETNNQEASLILPPTQSPAPQPRPREATEFTLAWINREVLKQSLKTTSQRLTASLQTDAVEPELRNAGYDADLLVGLNAPGPVASVSQPAAGATTPTTPGATPNTQSAAQTPPAQTTPSTPAQPDSPDTAAKKPAAMAAVLELRYDASRRRLTADYYVVDQDGITHGRDHDRDRYDVLLLQAETAWWLPYKSCLLLESESALAQRFWDISSGTAEAAGLRLDAPFDELKKETVQFFESAARIHLAGTSSASLSGNLAFLRFCNGTARSTGWVNFAIQVSFWLSLLGKVLGKRRLVRFYDPTWYEDLGSRAFAVVIPFGTLGTMLGIAALAREFKAKEISASALADGLIFALDTTALALICVIVLLLSSRALEALSPRETGGSRRTEA